MTYRMDRPIRDYFEHVRTLDFVPAPGPRNAWQTCIGAHLGAQREALCWIDTQRVVRRYTFEQLDTWSAQFAQLLRARGIGPGAVVAGLLPRRLELLIVVLGTWRAGAVYQPLFTAFGPKALEHRLAASGAALVVCSAEQRPKLDEVAAAPPILTLGSGDGEDFWAALEGQPQAFDPVPRRREDPCMIMFTSGTTGAAKALRVPLHALDAIATYMRDAGGAPREPHGRRRDAHAPPRRAGPAGRCDGGAGALGRAPDADRAEAAAGRRPDDRAGPALRPRARADGQVAGAPDRRGGACGRHHARHAHVSG